MQYRLAVNFGTLSILEETKLLGITLSGRIRIRLFLRIGPDSGPIFFYLVSDYDPVIHVVIHYERTKIRNYNFIRSDFLKRSIKKSYHENLRSILYFLTTMADTEAQRCIMSGDTKANRRKA